MNLSEEDKHWILEQLERVETNLLTEFHKWGRTSDVRSRQHGANISMHDERMQILEDRVAALERKHPGA